MKLSSLFLALSLIAAPAGAAMRGSGGRQRRAEDPAGGGDLVEDEDSPGRAWEDKNEGEKEKAEGNNSNQATPAPGSLEAYYQYQQRGHSSDSSTDATEAPGFVLPPFFADPICDNFCSRYLQTCVTNNQYFVQNFNIFDPPDYTLGAPARRRLIAGFEPFLRRFASRGVDEVRNLCLFSCALFPRPYDPAQYDNPVEEGVNTMGDTFYCRDKQLSIAEGASRRGPSFDPVEAQVRCIAAAQTGGYNCLNYELTFKVDVLVPDTGEIVRVEERATLWEFQRASAASARRLGYCDMYGNDQLADCTKSGLDDDTLGLALALLPATVRYLILNNNLGITTLGARVFANNLVRPRLIEAIIMDDGNLLTIHPDALRGMERLQVFTINMQRVAALPFGLFTDQRGDLDAGITPSLKEFSIKNTRDRPGQLTALPSDILLGIVGLQRFVVSGHRGLTDIQGGDISTPYPNVKSVDLSNNGFTNAGIPDALFRTLFFVQSFDLSGNELTTVKATWFDDQQGNIGGLNLLSFSVANNPVVEIEANAFQFLVNLEYVFLHDTDLVSIPVNTFIGNPLLISYTLRPRQ